MTPAEIRTIAMAHLAGEATGLLTSLYVAIEEDDAEAQDCAMAACKDWFERHKMMGLIESARNALIDILAATDAGQGVRER